MAERTNHQDSYGTDTFGGGFDNRINIIYFVCKEAPFFKNGWTYLEITIEK